MYGAIIGDMAGSIYEYMEFIDNNNGTIDLNRRLDSLNKNILNDKCFYSDDTILTMSILDSIVNNISYEDNLRKYGILNKICIPKDIPYFEYMFSPGFMKWCSNKKQGTSIGNGAMMRISPIGYLFNNETDIKEQSRLATIPSHNSELAVKCAEVVAMTIYLFRTGLSKNEVLNVIQKKYNLYLNYSLEDIQKTNLFDGTCKILEKLLYILKISNNFDEAIKYTLSIGGDTDTNACIVGSMAEALYGVPKEYIDIVNNSIPIEYKELLDNGYSKIKCRRNYGKRK